MKKTFILLCLCLMGYLANADVKVSNQTNCTYILSIPNIGYVTVPLAKNFTIPNYNYFIVTNIKVAFWPSYPTGSIIDQVFVQLYTLPTGTSLYPSCAGSNYSCKYTFLSVFDTLLEIF